MSGRLAFTLFGILLAACSHTSPAETALPRAAQLDHVWIATAAGAVKERAALEAAGFRISPIINRHEGQGTASATVEFENGFLELIWPDDSVPVNATGGVRGKQRFIERMNWRTNRVSPLGIALRRTSATPSKFPFETWEVTSEWMAPGTAMLMLTPRGSRAVNIAIHPHGTDEAANLRAIAAGGEDSAKFLHPNGARRITGLLIIAEGEDGLPPSADFVRTAGAADLRVGKEWLMELTLDAGRAGKMRDLRPTLPLIVRW